MTLMTSAGVPISTEQPAPLPAPNRPLLLVVTDNRFWRRALGSHVRIWALLSHMQQQGYRVVVVFNGRPYEGDLAQTAALQGMDVKFARPAEETSLPATAAHSATTTTVDDAGPMALGWKPRLRWWLRAGRAALAPARATAAERTAVAWLARVRLRAQEPRLADLHDPTLLAFVRQSAAGRAPAVVLVEYVRLAWLLPDLRTWWPAARFLVDTHDVMHERQARFHIAGQVHELDTTAAEEAALLSRFDAVLAIQERDAASFCAMGVTAPVLTVVHPVVAAAAPQRLDTPPAIGFLGSDMPPNRLALEELVFDIWPRLLRRGVGHAKLLVAGGVCSALQGRQLPAGVQPLGFVPDTADFYAQIGMVACPVRMGGGLKVKVVEALCQGKAVVTTAVGAEGMEGHPPGALQVHEDSTAMVDVLHHWLTAPAALQQAQRAALLYGRHSFSAAAAFGPLGRFLTHGAD